MKRLYLLVLTALIAFPVLSQSKRGYIYMKNGTILNGKFKYSNNLERLKVKTADKVWVFNSSEVDSIVGEKALFKKKYKETNSKLPIFVHTEIGVLAGNSKNSQSAPLSFTSSVNYAINPKFSAGIGVGVEFLKESYLPVFANLEYKFVDSYSTPYFFLKAGYQVAIEESTPINSNVYPVWSSWPMPNNNTNKLDTKGGFLINTGVGYQRMLSSGFGVSFAFGYQFHQLHYTGENDYGIDIDYNRLTIKLGFIF
jgi:hypothetical protein